MSVELRSAVLAAATAIGETGSASSTRRGSSTPRPGSTTAEVEVVALSVGEEAPGRAGVPCLWRLCTLLEVGHDLANRKESPDDETIIEPSQTRRV